MPATASFLQFQLFFSVNWLSVSILQESARILFLIEVGKCIARELLF